MSSAGFLRSETMRLESRFFRHLHGSCLHRRILQERRFQFGRVYSCAMAPLTYGPGKCYLSNSYTQKMAERQMTGSRRGLMPITLSWFAIDRGVERRVVVHLQLPI